MKVLAIYNVKGGVGKTSTAVNLAYLAAAGGLRTLLWDLDPQAATSFYLRVEPKLGTRGRRLVVGGEDLAASIRGTDFELLDLLPADLSCRKLDTALARASKPRRRLAQGLSLLADEYDLVVLDPPPGLSLLAEAIFRAADALVVPTIPSHLSLRALQQLQEFLRSKGPADLPVLPFLSMVDRRRHLHRQDHRQPFTELGLRFLETEIPYASQVEQMGVHRQPLPAFAATSAAAVAYHQLWAEVAASLGLAR